MQNDWPQMYDGPMSGGLMSGGPMFDSPIMSGGPMFDSPMFVDSPISESQFGNDGVLDSYQDVYNTNSYSSSIYHVDITDGQSQGGSAASCELFLAEAEAESKSSSSEPGASASGAVTR